MVQLTSPDGGPSFGNVGALGRCFVEYQKSVRTSRWFAEMPADLTLSFDWWLSEMTAGGGPTKLDDIINPKDYAHIENLKEEVKDLTAAIKFIKACTSDFIQYDLFGVIHVHRPPRLSKNTNILVRNAVKAKTTFNKHKSHSGLTSKYLYFRLNLCSMSKNHLTCICILCVPDSVYNWLLNYIRLKTLHKKTMRNLR